MERIDALLMGRRTYETVLGLGGGTPLFEELPAHLMLELAGTKVLLNAMVQSHYKRIR